MVYENLLGLSCYGNIDTLTVGIYQDTGINCIDELIDLLAQGEVPRM